MKADEEYKALKAENTKRASMTAQQLHTNKSACLVALASSDQAVPQPQGVLGTLDLYAVRALDGEVLIGKFCFPNVTTSCCMCLVLPVTELLHIPSLRHARPQSLHAVQDT